MIIIHYFFIQSGIVCTCRAIILDNSVGGNLLCDHNTAGMLTIMTMDVHSNRIFPIQIFANNSRTFTLKEDKLSE